MAKSDKIKSGDVVRLKAGGFDMTVESHVEEAKIPAVRCVWFQHDSGGTYYGEPQRHNFAVETLTKVQ